MLHCFKSILSVSLIVLSVIGVQANDGIYDGIYHSVYSNNMGYCSMLMNHTNIIGCEGPFVPRTGVLVPARFAKDLIDIKNNTKYYDFVPVLSVHLKDLKQFLLKLNQLENIAGVIIWADHDANISLKSEHSDDVSCPNSKFQGSNCYPWVRTPEQVIGSFFEHWKFPIFYIEDPKTKDVIKKCFTNQNKNILKLNSVVKPYCAAELYNPSYASDAMNISIEMCLRRKDRVIALNPTFYCNPISLENFYAPLMHMNHKKKIQNGSVLILAVRLDSISLFSGASPAFDSMFTALISSISIAETLTKFKGKFNNQTTKQVLFAFYGGESLDNIGSSSHLVHLINNSKSPLNENCTEAWTCSGLSRLTLQDIGYVLELNQLAKYSNDSTFWVYSKNNSNDSIAQKLLKMSLMDSNVKFGPADSSLPYPPSSLYSFVNLNKSDQIDMAVITNHNGHFENLFYHSVFDSFSKYQNVSDDSKLSLSEKAKDLSQHLSKLVTVVSRVLAEFIDQKVDAHSIEADKEFIYNLTECIFINQNCSLFYKIRSYQPGFYNQTNFYGTHSISDFNVFINELVYDLMKYATGEKILCPKSNETVDLSYKYYIFNFEEKPKNDTNTTKYCLRHQVFRQEVISPGYMNLSNDSNLYSQWAVSHKRDYRFAPRLRVFVMPTNTYSFIMYCIGIISIALAIVIINLFGYF